MGVIVVIIARLGKEGRSGVGGEADEGKYIKRKNQVGGGECRREGSVVEDPLAQGRKWDDDPTSSRESSAESDGEKMTT